MEREAVFVVVGLTVLGSLVLLAVSLVRLRARVHRLEHKATPAEVSARLAAVEQMQTRLAFEVQTQARLAAGAQAHHVTELRALRLDLDPPMYAPRSEPMRPPALLAPLAHSDLIGSEDHADEAARARLGPEELTPPRRGRGAMLVAVFQGPEEGGAA